MKATASADRVQYKIFHGTVAPHINYTHSLESHFDDMVKHSWIIGVVVPIVAIGAVISEAEMISFIQIQTNDMSNQSERLSNSVMVGKVAGTSYSLKIYTI